MDKVIDAYEAKLRQIEAELEEAGASICSIPNSSISWGNVNCALEYVRAAICSTYLMRK